MNRKYLLGGIAVAALVIFGAVNLRKSVTPYVGFSEARTAKAVVQVNGKLVKGTVNYDASKSTLRFDISDGKGETLPIVYHKPPPGNLETSTAVVVVGQFQDGAFQADDLLVKCPSKYVKKKPA